MYKIKPRNNFSYLFLLEINKGVRKNGFFQEKGKFLVQYEKGINVKKHDQHKKPGITLPEKVG